MGPAEAAWSSLEPVPATLSFLIQLRPTWVSEGRVQKRRDCGDRKRSSVISPQVNIDKSQELLLYENKDRLYGSSQSRIMRSHLSEGRVVLQLQWWSDGQWQAMPSRARRRRSR